MSLAAVALLATACAETDAQYTIPEVAAPQLLSTNPADNSQIDKPGDITMKVKYNKKIGFASADYTQLQFTGGTIDKAIVYGADSTLTIHATGLTRGTTCTLTIPDGLVKGPNSMPAPAVTFSFTVKNLPAVASAPVAATTTEARALYTYLASSYREKMLSGMMASVAWNNDESEKVYQWTGRYPAINGYDYIHLPASVRGANWINYADITPVKTWTDNGGIATIGWHWLVPKEEIGSGDEPAAGGDAQVVWEGSLNLGTDWSVSEQIAADKFADAAEGSVLTFSYSCNSDAEYWQAKLMDSSWNALSSYKDVDNGWGCIALEAGTDSYSFTLNAADAEALKTGGMVLSGYGITYKQLALSSPAKSRVLRLAKRYEDLDPNNDFSYQTGAFSLVNAVTEGTWENQFVKDDLARIVPYLRQLKEAGIPVLWRPLHEAAGGWFWWGTDAEAFKKLWRLMFDTFRQEGLTNLIWVWTSEGDDLNWYPGADYVDIIGRDLYGNSAADCAEEYEKLQNNYPGKIITLSECGYSEYTSSVIATVSSQWQAGATWAWFMPWYSAESHASEAWWKDAMESSFVVSRDQLPSFK